MLRRVTSCARHLENSSRSSAHQWRALRISAMIVYESRFLTRGEVWFDNSPTSVPVDWILYHQRPEPIPRGSWRPFYTRLIDLSQTPDALFEQMDGFTGADIRKAQKKDQTVGQLLEPLSRDVLERFYEFYDQFAARKNLPPTDRHWVERTAAAGKLDLWAANGPGGERLGYHVFYRAESRVRSVHSASVHAQESSKEVQRKIGRANRFLVWTCMLHYREKGVRDFDLGGWYNGKTDAARLGINKFKEGFGGAVVCEYEGEQLLTLKAWSAVKTARWLETLKQWRRPNGMSGPRRSRSARTELHSTAFKE